MSCVERASAGVLVEALAPPTLIRGVQDFGMEDRRSFEDGGESEIDYTRTSDEGFFCMRAFSAPADDHSLLELAIHGVFDVDDVATDHASVIKLYLDKVTLCILQ